MTEKRAPYQATHACQKCGRLPGSHRVRIMVDEERERLPSPTEMRGPVWSMDALVCGPCAAEVGMLMASQVLKDKDAN